MNNRNIQSYQWSKTPTEGRRGTLSRVVGSKLDGSFDVRGMEVNEESRLYVIHC